MQFWLLSIVIFTYSISANSEIELIKNGTFESDVHWNFALNGDAAGNGSSQNNTFSVTVTNPGSEDWFIQLTQNNISIKKDYFYTFSFEISASTPRKIVTSVCRNGDNYTPYSRRDTLIIDTTNYRYIQIFQMKNASDTTARVEFNFGKFPGDIKLQAISLKEVKEPEITFSSIEPQNIIISGEPVTLKWHMYALYGPLKLSISYNDGESWSVIDSTIEFTDSTVWIPGNIYSPWCLFKLSTPVLYTISSEPFQIVPRVDLIKNGSFFYTLNNWTVTADSIIKPFINVSTDSGLVISSNSPIVKPNSIILIQEAVKLDINTNYDLFFTCYSRSPSVVKSILSNCTLKDTTAIDTAFFPVSEKPTRFQARFLSHKTQSDGYLEFLAGSDKNDFFFNDISLITLPDTVVSNRVLRSDHYKPVLKASVFINIGSSCDHFKSPHTVFDISGRKLTSNISTGKTPEKARSRISIAVPKMNKPHDSVDKN